MPISLITPISPISLIFTVILLGIFIVNCSWFIVRYLVYWQKSCNFATRNQNNAQCIMHIRRVPPRGQSTMIMLHRCHNAYAYMQAYATAR